MSLEHARLKRVDLGKEVEYFEAMARMRLAIENVHDEGPVCFFLEHKNTITVTRQSGLENVHASAEDLARDGFDLVTTDRGGDVTFHGPGQLVGYIVGQLPFSEERVDLLGYVRALEQALIDACVLLGVRGAHRKENMTGVWVASAPDDDPLSWPADDDAKKLVAIGVGVKRGVTRHGFALNVTTDLESFTERILPCGLAGRGVTSLERVLPAFSSDDLEGFEERLRDVVFECLQSRILPRFL